jgi:hypothetical protein
LFQKNVKPSAGRDFIAVGNTDHSLELMGLRHRFDGVGNDKVLPRRLKFPFKTGIPKTIVRRFDLRFPIPLKILF